MSHKTFTRTSVLILLLLACFTIPVSAKAGGACSGTYTVQQDETIDTLAATCGTTTSAIYAANPGISVNLYVGQVLTIPSSNCPNCAPSNTNCAQGNCAPSYTNCNQGNCAPSYSNCGQSNCAPSYYNCSQGECAQTSSNGTTYVVQFGDTFGDIANRFGISMHDLWSANPNIGDANLLYPGQVLNIPSSSWSTPVPTPPWYGPQYNSSQYGPQYGLSQYGTSIWLTVVRISIRFIAVWTSIWLIAVRTSIWPITVRTLSASLAIRICADSPLRFRRRFRMERCRRGLQWRT